MTAPAHNLEDFDDNANKNAMRQYPEKPKPAKRPPNPQTPEGQLAEIDAAVSLYVDPGDRDLPTTEKVRRLIAQRNRYHRLSYRLLIDKHTRAPDKEPTPCE